MFTLTNIHKLTEPFANPGHIRYFSRHLKGPVCESPFNLEYNHKEHFE